MFDRTDPFDGAGRLSQSALDRIAEAAALASGATAANAYSLLSQGGSAVIPDAGSAALAAYVVLSAYADYLKCTPYVQPVPPQSYNPNFEASATTIVYIAKPYQLQQTPWQGVTVSLNGTAVTLNYTGVGLRTATNGDGTVVESQIIVPDYMTGDVILATTSAMGLVDPNNGAITLIDVNQGARAWAYSTTNSAGASAGGFNYGT